MGNETSFQSFPAHVHNLLTVLMAETHVVHTKVYPRYRSKRKITFARDDFSRWLEPHEDDLTDVVLLGHSMGGLLSAEVAIMPAPSPGGRPLKHRILGTINFDVPFLGMHPGIISSGLASIFAPADDKPDGASDTDIAPPNRADTLWGGAGQLDPNFNTPFTNDVVLPMRKGWENALHFLTKHSDNIVGATKQLVTSHLEFGGAMASYGELKARYGRIRALEEESGDVRKSVIQIAGFAPPRVRFINYYTASTGRPKKPKPEKAENDAPKSITAVDGASSNSFAPTASRSESLATPHGADRESSLTPTSSDFEYDGAAGEEDWQSAAETLTIMDPTPEQHDEETEDELTEQSTQQSLSVGGDATSEITTAPSMSSASSFAASLPPIPDPPTAPAPLDVSFIEDPDTRKLVEKEHARSMKNYEKAVKDREKIIKDRAKFEEKRERKAQKDVEKTKKDAIKAQEKAKAARIKEAQKQAKLERKETEKQMSQMDQEELRLQKEKERMEAEGRRMRGEPEPEASSSRSMASTDFSEYPDPDSSVPSLNSSYTDLTLTDSQSMASTQAKGKSKAKKQCKSKKDKGPPKDRVFCMLPPKDSAGQRDPCWVRIFMKDVDEVGAHCGLFFIDERYERLVGEVAERIESWITEDLGERRAGSMSKS